jgi:hypothetical protein
VPVAHRHGGGRGPRPSHDRGELHEAGALGDED